MFRYLFTFAILALVLIQSDVFTLPSSQRIPSSLASDTPSTTCLGMAICDIGSPVLVDRDTNGYKIYKYHQSNASELNDAFEKWTLQLLNDSSNTRSYVCRCLVQVARLSEDDSYRQMMQAHDHGHAVIREY